MATTTTKRVTESADASATRRVSIDPDEEASYDTWGGTWGPSFANPWGGSWRVTLPLSAIGATQRVTEAPVANVTKRV